MKNRKKAKQKKKERERKKERKKERECLLTNELASEPAKNSIFTTTMPLLSLPVFVPHFCDINFLFVYLLSYVYYSPYGRRAERDREDKIDEEERQRERKGKKERERKKGKREKSKEGERERDRGQEEGRERSAKSLLKPMRVV